jgi:hypothetical protein
VDKAWRTALGPPTLPSCVHTPTTPFLNLCMHTRPCQPTPTQLRPAPGAMYLRCTLLCYSYWSKRSSIFSRQSGTPVSHSSVPSLRRPLGHTRLRPRPNPTRPPPSTQPPGSHCTRLAPSPTHILHSPLRPAGRHRATTQQRSPACCPGLATD